ncbi:MAG: hypothetical protein QM809_10230 [Gordonia sp. (in: high G+C Gram-positive bacteria)]|uniref:hypothetical protein n=1 Tax=Gordonia sp. (in: high G+C Gram-positive bacteria) TaxID=84139 RepID=UPI0039E3B948
MSKNSKPGLLTGRRAGYALAALAIFVLGGFVGGGITGGARVDDHREQIRACLPIADEAALDRCLGGVR